MSGKKSESENTVNRAFYHFHSATALLTEPELEWEKRWPKQRVVIINPRFAKIIPRIVKHLETAQFQTPRNLIRRRALRHNAQHAPNRLRSLREASSSAWLQRFTLPRHLQPAPSSLVHGNCITRTEKPTAPTTLPAWC